MMRHKGKYVIILCIFKITVYKFHPSPPCIVPPALQHKYPLLLSNNFNENQKKLFITYIPLMPRKYSMSLEFEFPETWLQERHPCFLNYFHLIQMWREGQKTIKTCTSWLGVFLSGNISLRTLFPFPFHEDICQCVKTIH